MVGLDTFLATTLFMEFASGNTASLAGHSMILSRTFRALSDSPSQFVEYAAPIRLRGGSTWAGKVKVLNSSAEVISGPESQDTFLPLRQRLECFQRIESLKKKFGEKYRTNEVIKLEEESKYLLMSQRMIRTQSLSVDLNAAGNFQRYVVGELGFQLHRAGIMYGRVDAVGHAFCDVIYEPPQEGSSDCYKMLEGAEERARADRVAALLGLRPVGMVFTAKSRKCILSSQDILNACKLQKEMELAHGFDFARTCVCAVITRNATTDSIVFEAYQVVVEYCRTNIDVLVERKDTQKVDNDFFINSVPIKTHKNPLFDNREAEFAVENRPTQTQNALEVKHILKCHEDLPFPRRLSDYHMLLYLSKFLDPVNDMPAICQAVTEGRELSEGHVTLIEALGQV